MPTSAVGGPVSAGRRDGGGRQEPQQLREGDPKQSGIRRADRARAAPAVHQR
jgi:hypothetical protein